MPVIGLTGGIASGKSLVSGILGDLGARVIDADVVARQVVEPGTEGWQRIVDAFGPEITNSDRTINRQKLGEKVFQDPQERQLLNSITHPLILDNINREIASFRGAIRREAPVLVIDAPLLFETGLHKSVDRVWVVEIPRQEQIKRLIKRDGMSLEQAETRIASQMPAEQKRMLADVVIDNSGDVDATRQKIQELWAEILQVRG